MKNVETPEILRQDEAWKTVSSFDDLVTSQLLKRLTTCILKTYGHQKESLVSNFDLKFFVDAVIQFCSDHENLKRILAGEDLQWFGDDEIENGDLME